MIKNESTYNNSYDNAVTCYENATACYERGEYNESIEHAKRGLKLSQMSGYSYHDKFYRLIGNNYEKKCNYNECMKWWNKLSDSKWDKLESMGYRFLKLKNYSMAEKIYREHLESLIDGDSHSPSKIAQACSRLGEIYLIKNKPHIALSYLKTAQYLGNFSKSAMKKALQLSKGVEEKDDLLGVIYDKKIAVSDDKENDEEKPVQLEDMLNKITKESKSTFRQLDYRSRERWMNDSRYYWLVSSREYSPKALMESETIDKYWTNKTTNKLVTLLNKYRWELLIPLLEGKVSLFSHSDIIKIKHSLQDNGIRWKWISTNYLMYKMEQCKIRKPIPKFKKCKHCDNKYFEINSIGLFNWDYCYECTLSAYRGAYKKVKNKKEMIDDLRKLVELSGFIPQKSFLKGGSPFHLYDKLSEEKIEKILPIMINILPSEAYDLVFGSWLKALIESNILSDGTKKGSYSYICLAKDGHECLSLSEKIIDDWMYENNILHQIEPYYPFDKSLNPSGTKRADWLVGSTYIEFFGLAGISDYDEKTKQKRELVKKKNIKLIELYPDDLYELNKKLVKKKQS